ncbi:formate C-acetyltransferase [Zooshikella ganghwensis]|uniref:Formate acetyltransferase n=1 Tax=Zooshikella ganghwensis TaxID=202772 RepID=A0A4V1INF1_9GAMM|nr:formate C-acetyltransferase [Zooshikella ganghwensis]RDH43511.1 formate C-acetyltransferase [Zooshikella ganghwensis]
MYKDDLATANVGSDLPDPWQGFNGGDWQTAVNVRDFIQKNYSPYEGDDSFLAGPTERTQKLWEKVLELMKQENAKGGPLDFDTEVVSNITSHPAGYIDKDLEVIVGLQTEKPLKRAIMPNGGIRMVEASCQAYDRELSPQVSEIFTKYRKTHNQGVFDVYTPEILKCRKAGIVTGLPDAYGRGRIIGDYRRIALYGIDRLIEDKQQQKADVNPDSFDEDVMRLREELSDQVQALKDMKVMAQSYGFDISRPAVTAREAIQWTYFAYLAAVKSQNGAAMSIGRISSFLDIYIKRDIDNGSLTESEAQEMIDDLVVKLRMVRFLRTPEYDQLFSGDPTWVTEVIGGMGEDGRTLVTKNSFRVLNTLYNLGPAPEPNLTVLWSEQLPKNFKNFCSKVSIDTSSIQYESDDLMRPKFGDDYGIACCVSAMRIGKQMQFFGARCNLAKTMLYAINGGMDEKIGLQVGPKMEVMADEYLDFDKVWERFDHYMDWVANQYVKSLNIIHYMHDRYSYETALMALHDRDVYRTMACGIAGLSIVADSLAAIKYAKVKPVRNDEGYVIDYQIEGDFPKFGNNDDRVDQIAVDVVHRFMEHVRKNPTYRKSVPTQSILTITSNVVYGKKTGTTPDGRKAGEPFAPGANPMHGRDEKGALASLLSVSKLPYNDAEDGISYTMSLVPGGLGKDKNAQVTNLSAMLDGYFKASGHHVNVNVLNKETLMDAMEHPDQYPQLTIRVSGYAVNFVKLTREQQMDVISRTFHARM